MRLNALQLAAVRLSEDTGAQSIIAPSAGSSDDIRTRLAAEAAELRTLMNALSVGDPRMARMLLAIWAAARSACACLRCRRGLLCAFCVLLSAPDGLEVCELTQGIAGVVVEEAVSPGLSERTLFKDTCVVRFLGPRTHIL